MASRIRVFACLVILTAALGLTPGAALAQAAIPLSQLTIRLWPEYDKPGVLVFLIGQTGSGVTLPAELKFTLPQGSTVNAVAYQDTTNNILTDKVTHTVDGQNVSITTPNGNFHIEFYDPALQVTGGQRAYKFTWQQNFSVDQLTWEIEQPAGASALAITPPGGTIITDENGLPLTQIAAGSVAAGQPSAISVSYSKPTDTLSATALAQSRPAAAATNTAQPASSSNPLTIVLAVLLIALAAAVITLVYLRGGFAGIGVRVVDAETPQPRGKAARKPRKKSERGGRFCPQCGQPARPGDMFCRSCGAKLRS